MNLHVLTGSTLLALTLGAQQLLAPVATAAGGGTTATDGTSPAPTYAAAACAEVGVVTVDGSGTGWGDLSTAGVAMSRVGQVLEREVAEAGGSTVHRHLGTSFADVRSLVADPASQRPAVDVVTRDRARGWRTGTPEARALVQAELAARVASCPEQVLVLAGESQGAGVVHKVLRAAEGDATLAGHLAGAVLISDPNRASRTAARLYGEPVAPLAGAGVLTTLTRGVADVPTPTQDLAVATVCVAGDLVCDLGRTGVAASLAAHAAYDVRPGRVAVRDAARELAERVTAWPRVTAGQEVLASVGAPFSAPVDLRVGPAYADGVVVEPVGALPDGVSLDDGVLAGTSASAGTWDLPVRVRGTTPATSWATGTVTLTVTEARAGARVGAGGQSTCGVATDGSAWCAGNNDYGQLGDGTSRDRTEAVTVGQGARDWAGIDTSGNVTCGVKQAGTLYCWGANNRGQLGLGGGAQQWSPRQVGDSTKWKQVSVGWMHACGVRTNGKLFCWGDGDRGQLGTGGRSGAWVPERVGSSENWVSVTTGGWHSCGVREDGSAWCWGLNDLGQLGIGAEGWRTQPTPVDSRRSWVALDATWSSTCGLDAAGRISCWGLNDQGQVGDGSRTTRFAPSPVAGDREWTAVTVGDAHACGLDRRGAAWCWGRNRYGQLGNGTQTRSSTPVAVGGDRTWTGIDAGWMHTCALSPAGNPQCWGNNERGQLAKGDRDDRLGPPGVAARRAPEPARRAVSDVVATTFNVLGSQHTVPGGGTGNYAPGRIRSEWTAELLKELDAGIVSFQELQVDQYQEFNRAVGDRYAFYPSNVRNRRVVWQSVMWDESQWQYVDARILTVPVIGKTRPNPMVKLRNIATGRTVWVLNVHNSSKKTPERQAERDEAVRIEVAHILAERDKGVPVLFMGDMNERETVFCKVTGQTDLRAVTGGSHDGRTCSPPRNMHLDWIFASPEFDVRAAEFIRTPEVARITDHSVLTSSLSLG